MRALDLLDDRAPDAAYRHPSPFARSSRGANVVLGDATARPGAVDRCEVDREVAGEPVERERLERLRADDGHDGLGRPGRLQRQRRDGMQQLLSRGADQRQRGAYLRHLAVLGQDPEDDAVDRRADLDRCLVRLDLDDRLVLDDGIALAHEPARDLALGQPLAQIRQRERVRHGSQRSG